MWVKRSIIAELQDLANHYPVVMVTGPRQLGKTSLCRKLFPDKPYYSFENPDTRNAVISDPRAFFNTNANGAIIDEFQRYPELLSYMQGVVDEKQQKGQFILTGSNNVSMLTNVSQSLAGRVAILKLLPFSVSEILDITKNYSLDDYLYKGFYPGIYANDLNPTKAYRNYYETYIERDVRQLINIKDLVSFQKFIRLCAGQLFNASSIATEVGTSYVTIQSWLSVLQATYVVFMLQPWSVNLSKRFVKTPKLYFYDVGLASYLLGIENTKHIETHPLRGSLFENLVVVDLLKKRYNAGMDNNLFFYRDNHGNEVDVIQEAGAKVTAYEIKSAQTFTPHFLKGLDYLRKIAPQYAGESHLIYDGVEEMTINEHLIYNFRKL